MKTLTCVQLFHVKILLRINPNLQLMKEVLGRIVRWCDMNYYQLLFVCKIKTKLKLA